MIRLLLADDHAIVRGGLKQIFALQPDLAVTGEAINGAEVLEHLRHGVFDLLLLDLSMAGISGVELIARVKARQPELPVLVLSMYNEASVAARMLKAGASGYTSKDCEPAILLAAIRKVAAGGRYIAPEIAEKMVFETTTPGSVQLPHHQLTSREMLVFRLLTSGLGVTEIAAQLPSVARPSVPTRPACWKNSSSAASPN